MTSKSERRFILTQRLQRMLVNRHKKKLVCRFCGKALEKGKTFIRKITSGKRKSNTRYYHEKCWRNLQH